MNSLKDHIISEGIDEENLEYKIDIWFDKNNDVKQEFYEIVRYFNTPRKTNEIFDCDFMEKFIKKTNFNLKGFVDFITDNIYYSNIDDYYYISGTVLLSQPIYCDIYYRNGKFDYMSPSSNFCISLSHSNGTIYANVNSLNNKHLTISLAYSMEWIIFYT